MGSIKLSLDGYEQNKHLIHNRAPKFVTVGSLQTIGDCDAAFLECKVRKEDSKAKQLTIDRLVSKHSYRVAARRQGPDIFAETLKSETSLFSTKSMVNTGCEPCMGDIGCLDQLDDVNEGLS